MFGRSDNTLITTPIRHMYVHYTGLAVIQPWYETSGCGFYWIKNSYYLNQKTTQSTTISKYEDLFVEFKEFCASPIPDQLVHSNIELPSINY